MSFYRDRLYPHIVTVLGNPVDLCELVLAFRSSTTSMARLISSRSSDALSSPNSKMRSKNAISEAASNFANVCGSVVSEASP